MLLSLKNNIKKSNKETIKKKNKQTTTIQTNTTAIYSSLRLDHRWRCCQAIALNDQLVVPTSLAPLST